MNIETANRLYALRKKSGLSQEALAERIGVSRQAVSKWERAEASPDTDNLVLLAQVYGVSLDEMLGVSPIRAQSPNPAGEETADGPVTDGQTAEPGAAQEPPPARENTAADDAPRDFVSFRNGIHVHDKEGNKVDINLRDGVHVLDQHGAEVHVGPGGIYVDDGENPNAPSDHLFTRESHKYNGLKHFPYVICTVIGFLALGFALDAWYIAWLLFLTIPLFYSLIDAVEKRNPNHFAYPVLVGAVFLFVGLYYGVWHPTWVIFLTIPLYYGIIAMFRQR
ncbi:MAG: helix-turn-helix domain-containing protein [Candidatus Howiella sp.]|jgi:transcriptional regulator with XRE-family HTH domain